MSKPIFGLLPANTQLTPEAQQGVHHAKLVAVLGVAAGDPLPATGRGRPFNGGKHGGRVDQYVALLWGSDAALAKELKDAPAPSVVVVVTSKAHKKTAAALLRLEAGGARVHLCVALDKPLRVLPGGVVEVCDTTGWQAHATDLAPATDEPA